MLVSSNHHLYVQTSFEISQNGWMCQNPHCVLAFLDLHFDVMVYSCVQIDCVQVCWCCCWCWCCVRTQSCGGPRSSLMPMLEMAAKTQTKALVGCQPGSSKTVWKGWRTMSGPKFRTVTVFHLINVRTSYSLLVWSTDGGSVQFVAAEMLRRQTGVTEVMVQHKFRFV
jgi:hypothetical protein